MKKIMFVFLLLITCFSNICFAESGTLKFPEDFSYSGIQLKENFDVKKVENYFGSINKINNVTLPGGKKIVFAIFNQNMFMIVTDNVITEIQNFNPIIYTYRGIKIDNTVNDLVNKYGIPAYTEYEGKGEKYKYRYTSADGSVLEFSIDKGVVVCSRVYSPARGRLYNIDLDKWEVI
jgi:hypothetical protein